MTTIVRNCSGLPARNSIRGNVRGPSKSVNRAIDQSNGQIGSWEGGKKTQNQKTCPASTFTGIVKQRQGQDQSRENGNGPQISGNRGTHVPAK